MTKFLIAFLAVFFLSLVSEAECSVKPYKERTVFALKKYKVSPKYARKFFYLFGVAKGFELNKRPCVARTIHKVLFKMILTKKVSDANLNKIVKVISKRRKR